MLLTFDDGLKEMKTVVAPILKKRNIPAVFFLTTDFIDNKDLFFRNKISLLINFHKAKPIDFKINEITQLFFNHKIPFTNFKESVLSLKYNHISVIDEIANILNFSFSEFLEKEKPYLTTEQINELILDGFSIGSHSLNHPMYKDLSFFEQIKQTEDSINFIQQKFNPKFNVFAFPFNDHEVSMNLFNDIAKNTKVQLFFSTDGFLEDNYTLNIHRFWMEEYNGNAKKILIQNFKDLFFRKLKGTNYVIHK